MRYHKQLVSPLVCRLCHKRYRKQLVSPLVYLLYHKRYRMLQASLLACQLYHRLLRKLFLPEPCNPEQRVQSSDLLFSFFK